MSVHSNHYDNEEDYKADLAYEYRGADDPEHDEKHGCFDCFYRESCDSKDYYCPVKEGDWE